MDKKPDPKALGSVAELRAAVLDLLPVRQEARLVYFELTRGVQDAVALERLGQALDRAAWLSRTELDRMARSQANGGRGEQS